MANQHFEDNLAQSVRFYMFEATWMTLYNITHNVNNIVQHNTCGLMAQALKVTLLLSSIEVLLMHDQSFTSVFAHLHKVFFSQSSWLGSLNDWIVWISTFKNKSLWDSSKVFEAKQSQINHANESDWKWKMEKCDVSYQM